ncbi:DUF4369 domain-containing protein [Pedobacter steynii]|uniref:DUF4369 domain-containing protein n=1 Tax=Pedobacter steynii TaxID=430522 RepID=A0A1D7QN71_9SPHI|nr:DUF4369 domain-containing protein [Pedobacter steynii]AOM80116.1 hypothetical protein BFS30_24910 [Pedobacter steynii]
MKHFIYLFLLCISSFTSLAQSIKFTIQGSLKDTKKAKFAYLTTLSHQVPISSDKLLMVTPIKDGKFNFRGTFELDNNTYQHAAVFIEERGNISKEELISKFGQLILITDREKNFKHIILEDIDLVIAEPDQMKTSRIASGGKQTRILYEWFAALRSKNGKLLDFVRKFPDAQMSLDAVAEASSGISPLNQDKLEAAFGSPKELYTLLSERLKKSEKGMALRKKIYHIK